MKICILLETCFTSIGKLKFTIHNSWHIMFLSNSVASSPICVIIVLYLCGNKMRWIEINKYIHLFISKLTINEANEIKNLGYYY